MEEILLTLNYPFIISEEKAEEFKKLKRSKKLDTILEKAKLIKINEKK